MAQRAFSEHGLSQTGSQLAGPIDHVHLAKQCLGDENLELEILRMYDPILVTYFGRMQKASSFDDLAVNLHSIRGASVGVGAWTVADLAASLEKDLRDGRPLSPERIDDLGIAIEEVRDYIARRLADEAA